MMEKISPYWSKNVVLGIISPSLKDSKVTTKDFNLVLPKREFYVTTEYEIFCQQPDPLASAIEQIVYIMGLLHEGAGHCALGRGCDGLEELKKILPLGKTKMAALNILEDIPTDHRAYSSLPQFKNYLWQGQKYVYNEVLKNNLCKHEPLTKDSEAIVGLTLMGLACEQYFGSAEILKSAFNSNLIHSHYVKLLNRAESGGWLDRIKGKDVLQSATARDVYDFTGEILDKFFKWEEEEEPPQGECPTEEGEKGEKDNENNTDTEEGGENKNPEEENVSGNDSTERDGEKEDSVPEEVKEEKKLLEGFIESFVENHNDSLVTPEEMEKIQYNHDVRRGHEYQPAQDEHIKVLDYT